MDLNSVTLTGRISQDIEMRQTRAGTPVGNFSIANERVRNNGNDQIRRTSFFDCVVWGRLAEGIKPHLYKGQRIGVSGFLHQNSWEAQDGTRRYKVEIIVNQVQFLDAPKNQRNNQPSNNQQQQTRQTQDDLPDTDELPM